MIIFFISFFPLITLIKRDKPDMSYMDAVVYYCEENEIEIESVGKFISKTLKEKNECKARDLNYLPKVGKLPLWHKLYY